MSRNPNPPQKYMWEKPKTAKKPKMMGKMVRIAASTSVDPISAIVQNLKPKAAGKAIKKQPKPFKPKGMVADSARKTKQAQSIAVEKVRVKKQAAVQSKRATGAAVKAATKKKIDNKRKTGFYEKPKGK